MNQASCLCGDVSWEIDGDLEVMSHCHCSRCRKTHGAAFATYVAGSVGGFRLSGAERVVRWESSPGFLRCFCARCGSVVPGDPLEDKIFVPAGNFQSDPGARPLFHIFVASKVPWLDLRDDLPRFDAYPDVFDAPVVANREPIDPPGGGPRGSCLCGRVGFVVEGKPLRAHHCHCGRCRKARSAAFASNLFTTADGIRFTRGEDEVEHYKLPDARYFAQRFCRTCGSKMPRIDRERGLGIVAMATLDDDPGFPPKSHIFVASKAPWYTIADDLPQYPEGPP